MRKIIDDLSVLDTVLEFASNQPIYKQDIFDHDLPNDHEVTAFLCAEGFLKENERSFEITYKGRIHLNKGGFVGEHRKRVFSIVVSFATLVVALVGVILQFFV